jgi:hypothetical protein
MATKPRTTLSPRAVTILLRAGAAEQRYQVQRGLEGSARRILDARAHTRAIADRRKALRQLAKLAWIDQKLLPWSRPIAALSTWLRAPIERSQNQKAVLRRAPRRPVLYPHLERAAVTLVRRGESPAAIARFVVREILPKIPYDRAPTDPYDVDEREKQFADLIRKKPPKSER